MDKTLGQLYWDELESEVRASRACVERIPASLYDWKPHEKSMAMGYLALLVAEIPRWISGIINDGVINFATWKSPELKDGKEFATHLDETMANAKKSLEKATDEDLDGVFELRAGDKLLLSGTKKGNVSAAIRHLVHHRGQLTVYMRLNNIPVPSIYGPSADDKSF